MKTSLKSTLILITVIAMELLTGMEFDLFVPSFPQLQKHFALSPFWVEALLSINYIGYCASIFLVGRLSDRYGRKPIILMGQTIFVIGSLLCLYPYTYHFLIAGRLLQGIGIAAPAILSFLIIADAYPLKQQQFLMAILNGSINIAVAISPVLGSYLTWYFNWQGNFAALLLLGMVTLIMTLIFIPAHTKPMHDPALMMHDYGTILKSKPLMLIITSMIFIFVPYWIFVGMSPLLYIKELHVSLAYFGFYQGSLALIFAIGSLIYGFVIRQHNFDQKNSLQVSLKILIASLIIILAVSMLNSRNPLLITLSILPFIISQIIPSIILYPLALHYIPEAKARVSAIIQGAKLIFTAIGLQLAGYLYSGSFQSIGLILAAYILIGAICLYFVINNDKLMTVKN